MKKLLFLMMALMAAPAMAAVTFSIVDNGDLTADIVVTATGADTVGGLGVDSLVAGIALDVSVDSGEIVDVTNYMTTGESVDGAEGYGIYMGTIQFTGDPCEIDLANPAYSPVAPHDDPGSVHDDPFPTNPASALTLEFGCLYDVSVPADAPEAVTTLCTIEVSEGTTLTLAENATRNGVVLLGGGDPSSTNLPHGDTIAGDEFDFGDAPDPLIATAGEYPTLQANTGASHIIGGPFLGPDGDEPDAETDGQPSAGAVDDDGDGNDDEDGVTIGTLIAGDPAASVTFEVNGAPTVAVYVDGWIDFNADGDWDDAGEKIVAATYTDGIYSPTFAVPAGAVVGTTYVRFRINTVGPLDPDGEADDGEVEDHTVVIDKYTVTFVAGANGSISGDLSQEIAHGGDCTAVDPEGDSGYHFVDWTGDYTGTDDPLTITNVTADMTITANFEEDPCYTGPDTTEWESVGSPDSWCADYQCHGDADDATEKFGRASRRVGYNDINILLAGFNQPYSGDPDVDGGDPGTDPDTWIAADFDHASEKFGRASRRVGYADINVLLWHFNDAHGAPPADCQDASPSSP